MSLMAFEGILEIDFRGACFDYTWLILMMSLTCTQADTSLSVIISQGRAGSICVVGPKGQKVRPHAFPTLTRPSHTFSPHLISKSCSQMYYCS